MRLPIVPRTLAPTLQRVSAAFPVLRVTGPRRVGKTTRLELCAEADRRLVTLDDLDERDLARRDPALFLQRHPPPLIIDEVQYAPELFSAIKIAVDRAQQPGLFWLPGSQKFHLMQGVNESLMRFCFPSSSFTTLFFPSRTSSAVASGVSPSWWSNVSLGMGRGSSNIGG